MTRTWVKALLLGTAAFVASPSLLPAGDEVGVFFDSEAEENCIEAQQSAVLNAYLLLVEPSASVAGWECSLEVENIFLLDMILSGEATNFGSGDDYVVGLTYPLPASRAVQLARMSVMVTGSDPAGFFILPTTFPSLDGTPAYADGSDPDILLPMTPNTIGSNSLVAGINWPNCLPDEATWGRVKAMFYD